MGMYEPVDIYKKEPAKGTPPSHTERMSSWQPDATLGCLWLPQLPHTELHIRSVNRQPLHGSTSTLDPIAAQIVLDIPWQTCDSECR